MSSVELPRRGKEPRSRSEKAALSDKRLIQAALELIAESGIERVTLRSIGERAGYSRGLVNYRFGTKEKLLREATKRLVQHWTDDINDLNEQRAATGLSAISRLIERHQRSLVSNKPESRAYHALLYSALGPMPNLREQLAQVNSQMREQIATWIEDGVANGEIRDDTRPMEAASWIDAAARGVAYQWYMDPDGIDLEQTFSNLLTAIHRALRRPPT